MRLLIQRVTEARCHIDGNVHSQIGKGLVVLVGVGNDETDEDITWLTRSSCNYASSMTKQVL